MTKTQKYLSYGLIVLGLFQTIGFLTNVKAIRGIGLASMASPLPLVFSQFRGYETFAARFDVELLFKNGEKLKTQVTPELYSKLGGPYNRRNTYGGVISYGPALTEEKEKHLVNTVLHYGFCNNGPLATGFGATNIVEQATVYVTSRTQGRSEVWPLSVRCTL